ncbi:STAS domain-containing protein [Actinomadura parmotrematis]|uniref:Anti-sigma factor antagonist n=1 Tax=Actinomadura parmotrematis TaxID=2864039 RepID=A0ABS7G1H6_9ACTN|nr:STAS domain-containing protein [Actinomadura parmotrematis]MBW8486560.1 STAS domain-containing protein [Actinomadura parmotrematis]
MDDDRTATRRPVRRGPGVRCRAGASARRAPVVPPDGGGPGLALDLVRVRGHAAALAVAGEIDLSTADALRDRLIALHDAGHRRLVVDFAGVAFCDAAGLGALVAARNHVTGRGGDIRLARLRPAQERLVRLTGLHALFDLHDDLAGAVAEAAKALP